MPILIVDAGAMSMGKMRQSDNLGMSRDAPVVNVETVDGHRGC